MTILRMTASFGRLEKQTLELTRGLNVLTLPNEGGKSTWSAFLLAMFYGIDTAERAKAGSIPAKTKYKPWSGAPMEGTLELEWNGSVIVLERTSRGRVPMGQFRAYEKESGAPVPGLTGDNCGQTLLGVPRSVFERSAFVRQLGLAVDADSELEKRLSSLVSSGEEDVSAADTAKRLRDWKNRLRHNKTGLIPETQQTLDAVEASLAQLRAVHSEELTLHTRRQALAAQKADLLEIQSGLEALAAHEKLRRKRDAQAALFDANNRLAGAQARVNKLPDRAALATLAERIRQVDTMDIPPAPEPVPPAPACPEAFRGVPETQIMEKAARDGREFDRLTALRRRPVLWDVLGFALFAVVAVLSALRLQNVPLCAVCAALALAAVVKFVLDRRHNRQYEANLDVAQALLALYEQRSRDEFTAYAAEYAARLAAWQQQREQLAHAAAQRQRLLEEKNRQTAQLIGSAAMLAADVQSLAAAGRAVAAALAAWDTLSAAQAAAAQAQAQYDAVSAALSDIRELPLPSRDLSAYTAASVRDRLHSTELEINSIQSQLDQSLGRVAALGDPAALAAEQQQLAAQCRKLEAQFAATEAAEQALSAAAEELQRRFAPAITAKSSEILSLITNGKYDRILLDHRMEVEAGEHEEPALRPGGYLSAGTRDALYLALRLAICELALPEGTPLVLDDALVCFDDARLQTALAVLRQEAATRQILLFTCQSREAAALQAEALPHA